MSTNDEQLRKQAVARLKSQRSFWGLLGIFVIVSLILTVIWLFSSRGYFWPMWAMFGMGIALLFAGWNAYGPRENITESDIQDEMRKMQGGG